MKKTISNPEKEYTPMLKQFCAKYHFLGIKR